MEINFQKLFKAIKPKNIEILTGIFITKSGTKKAYFFLAKNRKDVQVLSQQLEDIGVFLQKEGLFLKDNILGIFERKSRQDQWMFIGLMPVKTSPKMAKLLRKLITGNRNIALTRIKSVFQTTTNLN